MLRLARLTIVLIVTASLITCGGHRYVTPRSPADDLAQLEAGQLSPQAAALIIQRALDIQGDMTQPWDQAWGSIIETAGVRGLLSEEQTQRYCDQATRITLAARPRIQQGRRLRSYAVMDVGERIGPLTQLEIVLHAQSLHVNDAPIAFDRKLVEHAATWKRNGNVPITGYRTLPIEPRAEVGELRIAFGVQPQYTWQAGDWSASVVTGRPRLLEASITIVDHPTGNYVDANEVGMGLRSANAWICISEDPSMANRPRCLMFQAYQPEKLHRLQIWFRRSDQRHKPYMLTHGHFTSINHFAKPLPHFATLVFIDPLRKRLPGATHIDVLVRPDVMPTETWPTAPLTWLGQWRFEDVPLDAEVRPMQLQNKDPRTLAAAGVSNLSLEEIEQRP